jgi:hypothetical protein
MSAIIGQRVTDSNAIESEKLPRAVQARPRFWFITHPHCWAFDGGEWLPVPSKMSLDPGCNGVTDGGGTDLAVAQLNRRGWQIVRPSDKRLGDFQWYVQEIPKQGRGRVYTSIFDEVSVVGSRVFWDHDDEGWRAFRRHLAESGICQPITRQVYELEISKQGSRVERLEGGSAAAPHNQVIGARLIRERERLDAMVAARPAHLDAAKAKPTRRRKVKAQRIEADIEASP